MISWKTASTVSCDLTGFLNGHLPKLVFRCSELVTFVKGRLHKALSTFDQCAGYIVAPVLLWWEVIPPEFMVGPQGEHGNCNTYYSTLSQSKEFNNTLKFSICNRR